jgi:CRP/FNR family transcriptional regulator, cyclic AMP receptor protein
LLLLVSIPFTPKLIIMKHKILIVEDNGPIRENTTELLELSNYTVTTATNGAEALNVALQQTPDLILCDIHMPQMDGYHLLQHIRKQSHLKSTRFIFFTASAEKKEMEEGMQMGADDYIVKPFQPDELLQLIEKHLTSPVL